MVEAHRFYHRFCHTLSFRDFDTGRIYIPHLRRALRMSFSSCSLLAVALAGSARITRSAVGGRSGKRDLHTCRSRREVRWRTTAFPTAFETTNPNLGPAAAISNLVSWLVLLRKCTTTVRVPARLPPLIVLRNSAGEVSLCWAGSTIMPTALRGPSCDELRRWRDLHGCSCGCGNRAYERDDGCWAGRYAYPLPRLSP